MTTQQLVPVNGRQEEPRGASGQFTADQLALLTRTIAKGATPDEFALFVAVCRRTGLDPFARQISAIRRGDKLSIEPTIDGARLVAARTGEYEGQAGPFWCAADGLWRDVWLEDEPPAAARVGVWRRGFREPVWGVARTQSYRVSSNRLWSTIPEAMVAKCAEMQALRKAFPMELSGLYLGEEMGQADGADPPPAAPRPGRSAQRLPAPMAPQADQRAAAPVADLEGDARRQFWAVAQDLGEERGFATVVGKFSKRLVHRALGVPEEDGALVPYAAAYGWDTLRHWLEDGDKAPPLGRPDDVLAPDVLPDSGDEPLSQAPMPVGAPARRDPVDGRPAR